eukprot:8254006-Pyramimonas_sp.AAC.1
MFPTIFGSNNLQRCFIELKRALLRDYSSGVVVIVPLTAVSFVYRAHSPTLTNKLLRTLLRLLPPS